MTTVSVTVDVDVDISDFDDDVIHDEFRSRFALAEDFTDQHNEALQGMFISLSHGREQEALDKLRVFLCDCLGRVI